MIGETTNHARLVGFKVRIPHLAKFAGNSAGEPAGCNFNPRLIPNLIPLDSGLSNERAIKCFGGEMRVVSHHRQHER
jgi:hypothetical protein